MAFRTLELHELKINRANDRHGELENETSAIAWLFHNREQHMRNLARDIVEKGEVYEPPLVSPFENGYIVFDGNRRVTCLKLLENPHRAPSVELQSISLICEPSGQELFPIRSTARLKMTVIE